MLIATDTPFSNPDNQRLLLGEAISSGRGQLEVFWFTVRGPNQEDEPFVSMQ